MKIFNNSIYSQATFANLKSDFVKFGIVNISSIFDGNFVAKLGKETLQLFYDKMQRKDFLMKYTENTPRNMFSVSERSIDELATLIPYFYYSKETARLISQIAEEPIDTLPWAGERYVINGLSQSNDTHGWHWDDYAYALIFIAKAPKQEQGGHVECVNNTCWNRENPNISSILAERKPTRHYFEDNSFYLMKSDTTLHRVAPLTESSLRVAIAMSWCNQADLIKELNHETVYELYGV
jgi:hypothetical protein